MITDPIYYAATTPMIKSLVEKVITPRIKQFVMSVKKDYKEFLHYKNYFLEYYLRTYEKYKIVNTLVFHNSQRFLKDIYIPQTIVKQNLFKSDEESYRIDRFPTEIKKYKKILITDTAGMGKSTMMKYMFIDLIDRAQECIGMPIYIELNRLKKDHTILSEIKEELSPLSNTIDIDILLGFIQTGGFVFFLDGYDEISILDRIEVTRDIQSFISKAGPDNYFIMTSRPENGLISFGDFYSFYIKPFSKEEAFELLRKYDGTENKELSGQLVDLLESEDYVSFEEYLDNPLLVSLLYAAYDCKHEIPLKKHLFYRQVYDTYFDHHDLAKGIDAHEKHSGLDIDDFNRVLRYVAYECLIKIGVKFDKDTILSSIDKAKSYCGNLVFRNNDFLKDLMTAVPLFTMDGVKYRWVQKTLMEYFAARFIADDTKESRDKILSAIYNSENLEKYLNMLDIYYDIDHKGFSKNITLPFCEGFLKLRDDSHTNSESIKIETEEEWASFLYAGVQIMVICEIGKEVAINKDKNGGTLLSRIVVPNSCDSLLVYGDIIKFQKYQFLYKKQPNLFCKIQEDNKGNNIDFLFRSLKPNNIFYLDLNSVVNDEKNYRSINTLIHLFSEHHFINALDVNACKSEIRIIKNEIERGDDFSFLTEE